MSPNRPQLLNRPVSDSQRETARRNGANSRGPTSARGKRTSSLNARTYGLYASLGNLTPADQARYEERRREYAESHPPATPAESQLIDLMALSRTRLDALMRLERAFFDQESINLNDLRPIVAAQSLASRQFHAAHELWLAVLRKRTRECVDSKTKAESRAASKIGFSSLEKPLNNVQ